MAVLSDLWQFASRTDKKQIGKTNAAKELPASTSTFNHPQTPQSPPTTLVTGVVYNEEHPVTIEVRHCIDRTNATGPLSMLEWFLYTIRQCNRPVLVDAFFTRSIEIWPFLFKDDTVIVCGPTPKTNCLMAWNAGNARYAIVKKVAPDGSIAVVTISHGVPGLLIESELAPDEYLQHDPLFVAVK